MSNGATHQLAAAVTVGAMYLSAESDRQTPSAKPVAGAVLAALMTNLPDILEPASHPNHRQFFHSVAFAGLIGTAALKLHRWEPDDEFDKVVRFALLVGAGAYLIHLLLDACTSKSLPLVGRLCAAS
jgi:membrane-bound metal-dependent hydrolase YbcI (DUF457 family)